MKLHLANPDGVNTIRAFSQRQIRVNADTYSTSVIVLPQAIKQPWEPRSLGELNEDHIAQIVEMDPELVLLGTGDRLQFPHPSITRALTEAGIGLEVMDTSAACRTYNIIMAEGRNVAAALINPGES